MTAFNVPDKIFTWEEIRKHNSDSDCWVVMYDYVCDMTDFLPQHPGGLNPIRDQGGYDTTKMFEAIGHSKKADKEWQKRIIGKLDKTSVPPKVERKESKYKKPVRYSAWNPVTQAIAVLLVLFLLWQFVL